MIGRLLDVDGPVMAFFDKTGQLIAVSFFWLLGCLPLVTVGTSSTAMYYTVMKVIRRGQGTVAAEFWKSYRANLGRGIGVTVLAGALAAVLVFNLQLLQSNPGQTLLSACTVAGLAVLGFVCAYICPVLSRFTLKLPRALMLSFVMAVRFFPITLVLLLGTGLAVGLQIYVLPMPLIALVPGLWCYGCTFLTEKALRAYMPEKQETDDAWYYE